MATEITMPKLSDTMTEGQLGAWRKSVGDRIERGDIIAEIETDKATMDLEAFTSGILLEQRVQAGELVPVGAVIGLIGKPDETSEPTTAHTEPPPPMDVAAETADPSLTKASSTPPPPQNERDARHGIQAAPVVRRRAAELGIDISQIHGSGPNNRIMLDDLQSAAYVASDTATPAEKPVSPPPQTGPLSRMRRGIARTTVIAWQSIPHFYLTRDIEMDQAVQMVHTLKSEELHLSLNAIIMAAAAKALTCFPALNATFNEDGIVNHPNINLAFAVALDDGLQMPVVNGAEHLDLPALSKEIFRLTENARQGNLTANEISGGSFSISNLGMHAVDSMASIIMPGQAGILGLGTVAGRPVARDGQLAVARVMTATLSCDHRLIDGAIAAGFLNELKRLLEHPTELPGVTSSTH